MIKGCTSKRRMLPSRTHESHCFGVFIHDSLCQFTALTAFTGNAKFTANIGEGARASAAYIADLMVSNLSANTYVHCKSLSLHWKKTIMIMRTIVK